MTYKYSAAYISNIFSVKRNIFGNILWLVLFKLLKSSKRVRDQMLL